MNIKELVLDSKNANKGTDDGKKLLHNSFQKFGAGRGVLVDKNNKLIAGNHAVQEAIDAGITKVIIVETEGNELVVTKRKDVDLDSKFGREMAIADNNTALKGIQFDNDVLVELQEEFDIDLDELGVSIEIESNGPVFNEGDYDEDDAAEAMETSGSNDKDEPKEYTPNIFPLSISLTKAKKLEWEKYKKNMGWKNDQEAFEAIYESHKHNV